MDKEMHVEIFERTLELDAQKLCGVRLEAFMGRLKEKVLDEVRKIFNKYVNFRELIIQIDWVEDQGENICKTLSQEVLDYARKISGLNDIELAELKNRCNDTMLLDAFRDLRRGSKEQILQVELELRAYNISKEERAKKAREVEKRPYNQMKCRFEECVESDIDSIMYEAYLIIPMNLVEHEEKKKASLAFQRLKEATDRKQEYDLAFTTLQLDPTREEYYKYCMMEFPEQLDGLIEIYCGVGFKVQETFFDKVSKNMYNKLPHETEEETLVIKRELDRIQKILNIDDTKIYKKVNELVREFDLKARTFQDILFSTREIKQQAEEDYSILCNKYKDIQAMSEEECKEAKIWISEQEFVPEISTLFKKKMDERVGDIWKEEDERKFIKLFDNVDLFDEKSKDLAIKIIQQVGRTEDKERYINALRAVNEQNINELKKYKEWEQKTTLQKYGVFGEIAGIGILICFFSDIGILCILLGGILLMAQQIQFSKRKKIWNVLTINGIIVHPQLQQALEEKEDETDKNNLIYRRRGENENIIDYIVDIVRHTVDNK